MPFDTGELSRRLNTRLKMRHLMLLLQIRQHGSLTRAAEHLASSQPAITNALAELESMFGGPLFIRSPRGMVPTALGDVVLERAQAMLHDLDHLTRDIEAVVAGHATRLHIGVIPFISDRMLAAAIARMRSQVTQRLTVTIHEGSSDALMAQLSDHTLDFVIARASSTVDLDRLHFDVLHRQTPRLIASRRLAARLARSPLDWPKLAALDWILGAPHTPIRKQVANLFLHAGVAPPVPIIESHSSRLIGEVIVANEDTVSIVPADIAEELVRLAGVAIEPYSFDWTLPPVAAFTRAGAVREIDTLFAQVLRALYHEREANRAA
ncbi:MAG: LysR family transcriptional regulator [Janthinobacterium lividum]